MDINCSKTRLVAAFWILATGLVSLNCRALNIGQATTKFMFINEQLHDTLFANGRLENGFSYYIAKNKIPDGKILIRFVVKCGYFQERKDQTHLSHVLEHLAFTKTQNYSNVAKTLREYGLQIGVDYNASTGFSGTEYWISIPSNNPKLLKECFNIIGDWCQRITLDSLSVENERGTVLNEIGRASKKATQHSRIFQDSVLNESHAEIVQNVLQFKQKALIELYKDWYRPDLQGVIVVGQINVDEIREIIHKTFSDLKKPDLPPKWTEHSAKLTPYGLWNVQELDEQQTPMVQRFFRRKGFKLLSDSALKQLAVIELFNILAKKRIDRSGVLLNPEISSASIEYRRGIVYPDGECDALVSTLILRGPENAKALKNSVTDFLALENRIATQAFSEDDLKAAKKALIASSLIINDSTSNSESERIVAHFLGKQMLEQHPFLKSKYIELIEEVNILDICIGQGEWFKGYSDTMIRVDRPHTSLSPDSIEFGNWIAQAKLRIILADKNENENDGIAAGPNMPPISSSMLSNKKHISAPGLYTLNLDDGTDVFLKALKPEANTPRRVQICLTQPYPVSTLNGNKLDIAYAGPSVVVASVASQVRRLGWSDVAKKQQIKMLPIITEDRIGISIAGNADAINLMIQSLKMACSPRAFTRSAYNAIRRKSLNRAEKWNSYDSMIKNLYGTDRIVKKTKFDLRSVNYWVAKRHFSLMWNTAVHSNRIVVAGAFSIDTVEQLIYHYFGVAQKKEISAITPRWPIPLSLYTRRSAYQILTNEGDGSRTIVLHFFSGAADSDTLKMRRAVFRNLLQEIVYNRLREKDGDAYYVLTSDEDLPLNRYRITITFNSSYGDISKMVDAVREEAANLAARPPSLIETRAAIDREINNQKRLTSSIRFWAQYMCALDISNINDDPVTRNISLLEMVKPEDISNCALMHLELETIHLTNRSGT